LKDRVYNVTARLVRATRIMVGVWTGGPDKPGHADESESDRSLELQPADIM
jgi:hypothetical protein